MSPHTVRGLLEAALDEAGGGRGVARWPWSLRLSAWVDLLITVEEAGT